MRHDAHVMQPGAAPVPVGSNPVHRVNRVALRRALWLLVASGAIAGSAWLAYAATLRSAIAGLHKSAEQQLELVAARLDGELTRFDYLPSLLDTAPNIFELLASANDPALRESVSRYLRAVTVTSGAEKLFVIQPSGMTVASDDWDQPGTLLGTDLSFRPYVGAALADGHSRFFGVGYTTGRAGYFQAYALQHGGVRRGVAAVKVSLDAVERGWQQQQGKVLVVDARDVVILASVERWKMRPLSVLSTAALAEAAAAKAYGTSALEPLQWRVEEPLDAHTTRVSLDSVAYVASDRAVNQGLWRVLLLDEEAPARESARTAAVTAALACLVTLLLFMVLVQRRAGLHQQQASRRALQAAHDSLETKVLERTAELRAVQNDLVHAGKLAALGQMSAGVVHELNQPLAAMRTLSDNAVVLLHKGRVQDGVDNLDRIVKLIARLARLTQQLKVFAYKTRAQPQPVLVRKVVEDALLVCAQRSLELGVETQVDIEPEDLRVLGDDVRLEQVLVNVVSNALDAMSAVPERRLEVRAHRQGDSAVIVIADSGPGISPDVLARVFEPFLTTKPAGKGLGLGLMISAHIVLELGGRMRAANRGSGGAEFMIELPLGVQ